jgi:hypothetical protein
VHFGHGVRDRHGQRDAAQNREIRKIITDVRHLLHPDVQSTENTSQANQLLCVRILRDVLDAPTPERATRRPWTLGQ